MFSDTVRCVAVVGAQWGDEGKGKLVDVLAEQATIVARYQGGANAGHTVLVGGDEFVLHLVPSGILYPGVRCLLGNGVVVDPWTLSEEIADLQARGVDFDNRLGVSHRAHLVLPYHHVLDEAQEEGRGAAAIGTTGRGIGPAYRDKVARIGLRLVDLRDEAHTREIVELGVESANATLERLGSERRVRSDEVLAALDAVREEMLALSADTGDEIRRGLAAGGRVLLEGAQGSLLDIDHGTYPFVTSSSTTAGGAAAGVGIGPTLVDEVLGVTKAYTTRVGNGPFPTELDEPDADRLRQLGGEYGATTGRPRRPGWFDAMVVGHAAGVNGLTSLAVTKLDVLDEFDSVQVATAYRLDGRTIKRFPDSARVLDRVTPEYETLAGWKTSTSDCRSWDELPDEAKAYLVRLEAAVDVPIRYISVGAARLEIIPLATGGVAAARADVASTLKTR